MVFDYGAPVGFRLTHAKLEKVTALISQNGNAYEVGLQDAWDPIRAFWQDPSEENRNALRGLLTPATTVFQYTHGVPEDRLTHVSPDAIAHDQAILDREPEPQLDLFGEYRTNIALYPAWQAYFREHQPPFLAVWGRNDPFFGRADAEAFRRDLPDAEVHLFDTGHFALESHGEEIGAFVRDFLRRTISNR